MNVSMWVSAALGLLLGGVIVDSIDWHWIFFINVPPASCAA